MLNPPQRRNATGTVDVRLESAGQLFHSLDPHAGYRQIDERIEEFLIQEARALPRKAKIRVRLFVAKDQAEAAERVDVGRALRAHFAYRARVEHARLRDLLWRGLFSLVVGMLVLAICLRIGPWIGSFTKETTGNFVDTAFQIIGWAANWRPVEIFLYDWWPIAEDRRLFRRLAGAQVELLPIAEADADGTARPKNQPQPA